MNIELFSVVLFGFLFGFVTANLTEKRYTIDIEETTLRNALFENGKFVCFEDDTDEYLKKINEILDENEELKKEVKQLKNKIKTYNSTHELLKETIDRLRSDG